MFSHFFIDRPILASVPSILITLIGLVAVFLLPVAQYPEITPPTVQVACTYPGANAQVVADTVAAPIEQQVNGVEDMLYMSSQSSNDGTYSLTVTFKVGTDLNMAQVLVQNRVALATPVLPDVVKQIGVTVKKTLARPDVHRESGLARRPLRPALFEQLRPDSRQGRAGSFGGRGRRDRSSVNATTACASGSIPIA